MRLTYDVSCPACGGLWEGIEVDDSGLAPGEVRAIAACPACFKLTAASVRLTAEEVGRYRRAVLKTVQKMYQGYLKARTRLEERQKVMSAQARRGEREARETLPLLAARLRAMRPPDTAHLDARARELAGVEAEAPTGPGVVRCAECGEAAAIHREGHHGFEVPCPRCATKLTVKLHQA